MLDIHQMQPAIAKLCRELHVLRLDIFGSATGDNFTLTSDVDFLVEFDPSPGELFARYFILKERLEELLERPVDLVTVHSIRNPFFKQGVERSRVNVYTAASQKASV